MHKIILLALLALTNVAQAQSRDQFEERMDGIAPVYRSPAFMIGELAEHCGYPRIRVFPPPDSECAQAQLTIVGEWAKIYSQIGLTMARDFRWDRPLLPDDRAVLASRFKEPLEALEQKIREFQQLYPLPPP
jgi:hypothetical protein